MARCVYVLHSYSHTLCFHSFGKRTEWNMNCFNGILFISKKIPLKKKANCIYRLFLLTEENNWFIIEKNSIFLLIFLLGMFPITSNIENMLLALCIFIVNLSKHWNFYAQLSPLHDMEPIFFYHKQKKDILNQQVTRIFPLNLIKYAIKIKERKESRS